MASAWQRVFAALGLEAQSPLLDPVSDAPLKSMRVSGPLPQRLTPGRNGVEISEVFSVGSIVTGVLGRVSVMNHVGLARSVLKTTQANALENVDVREVFVAAEILCGWCASPTPRLGVAGAPRKRAPTQPIELKTRIRNSGGPER